MTNNLKDKINCRSSLYIDSDRPCKEHGRRNDDHNKLSTSSTVLPTISEGGFGVLVGVVIAPAALCRQEIKCIRRL
jgi:hypothetical protein